jgi:hypothetical protein
MQQASKQRPQEGRKEPTLPLPLPLLSSDTSDGGRRVPEGKALGVVTEMNVLEVESSFGILPVACVETNPGYVGCNETFRCYKRQSLVTASGEQRDVCWLQQELIFMGPVTITTGWPAQRSMPVISVIYSESFM